MAKRKRSGGNPAKPKIADPCPRCRKNSRQRNSQGSLSIWCLTCSEKARNRGIARYERFGPPPLSLEVLQAVAKELGLDDSQH